MYFEVTGVGRHMTNHVSDIWKAPCVTMHGKGIGRTHGMPCVNMHDTWRML